MSLRKQKISGKKKFLKNLKTLKAWFESNPPRDPRVLISVKRHIIEYENPKTPSRHRAKIRGIYHPIFMKIGEKAHIRAEKALQGGHYLH